nr:MAG TPA: Single strand binding protein [Caudoviricetes sp.]
MNKFIGIGRLVRDPELRYTQTNKPICTFTLAIDRKMSRDKKQEARTNGWATADFPRVNVWGAMAENCNKYLSKGSQCAVVGSLQTGSYQDKDGKTVYTMDILANSVEFLDSKTTSIQDDRVPNDDFFDDDFVDQADNGSIPF